MIALSAVIVGFITNRVQTRHTLLVMAIVWSLVQFPMLGTVSLEVLIACRIILGAGEGPATMEKQADDIARILDHAEIGRVPFAGVSIGGYVLFEFWRRYRARVAALAGLPGLVLVAGRYEGIDERVMKLAIDQELSIGDYVVSGGELPALVLLDALARLQPGALWAAR